MVHSFEVCNYWVLVGMTFFLEPEWMVVSKSVMGKIRGTDVRGLDLS